MNPLPRSFYDRETPEVAHDILGRTLIYNSRQGRMSGIIVETEAYPQRDPAAHHFRGITPRNQSMFLQRGHAYVYFSYGNHFMLNVSAELEGTGGGVLIRALEPLEGIERMQDHRGTKQLLDLTRGPGRVAQALQIDRTLDGIDLCVRGPLWLGKLGAADTTGGIRIAKSPRIGITRAAKRLLRFYERGSPFVSGPARLRI